MLFFFTIIDLLRGQTKFFFKDEDYKSQLKTLLGVQVLMKTGANK
jgi:hypothetical protein